MNDIEIFEQVLLERDGEVISKLAILRGGVSTDNPTKILNEAVEKYVDGVYHNQFIDIRLDDPWTRLIVSGINDLKYFNYDKQGLLKMSRYNKLNQLNKMK